MTREIPQLVELAGEVEAEAHTIQWTEPRVARHLAHIAHDLQVIATQLTPPAPPRQEEQR